MIRCPEAGRTSSVAAWLAGRVDPSVHQAVLLAGCQAERWNSRVELQLVLRPDKDRVRESAQQAVTRVSHLAFSVAAEWHALCRDRGIRQGGGALA